MYKIIRGLGAALVVGLSALAFTTSTQAASFFVEDTLGNSDPVYFGGEVSGNSSRWENAEVVGDYDDFAIHNAVIERVADDNDGDFDDLSVIINTNFAGVGNTSAAANMGYGALFIGSDSTEINFANNSDDTFSNDPGRFDYAVDMNYDLAGLAVGGTAMGSSTVWILDGSGDDVQQTVAGGTFREQQAWKPYTEGDNEAPADKENATASTDMTGRWEVSRGNNGTAGVSNTSAEETAAHENNDQTGLDQGNGWIEFVIKDFFDAGNPGATNNEIVFAWGMQCANDIVLGVIPTSSLAPPVPVPAGFVLLLSGLLGLGWLGRSRARQA